VPCAWPAAESYFLSPHVRAVAPCCARHARLRQPEANFNHPEGFASGPHAPRSRTRPTLSSASLKTNCCVPQFSEDDAWAMNQLQFMHNIPTLIRQSPESINSPHVYFCEIEWPAYAHWYMQSPKHSSLVKLYEQMIGRIHRGVARIIAGYK
jgi:hypothetical protein